MQNIRLHGDRCGVGKQFGHVVIIKNDDSYFISFGNLVDSNATSVLSRHLDKINKMDRTDVKEFYMDTLGNGVANEKGGAGLGFITIALKSKTKMNYQFTQLACIIHEFSL